MYSKPTPWNVIPTFALRQTQPGYVCVGGGGGGGGGGTLVFAICGFYPIRKVVLLFPPW